MRASNHLIGLLNFLTFLLSIPILGGGIWLSSRANNTDCMEFLQWPIITVGVVTMMVSLAGLAGACYRNNFLIYLYLWAMFLIIATLLGFVIFAYAVTAKGSGRPGIDRAYLDYSLADYSGTWLADRVSGERYWSRISACIRDSHVCRKMGKTINGVPETAQMFYLRKLNPIQSGCCKPPTSCGYEYVNETYWVAGEAAVVGSDPDCLRWSSIDQEQLCYYCDSCKAGVLASLKKSWRKASAINLVILVLLLIVYCVACAAFRHNKRIDDHEPGGETRMEKARPSHL